MIRPGLNPHWITARYHSRCPGCYNPIIPGDTVLHLPAVGTRCKPCARVHQAKAVRADIAMVDARAHELRTRGRGD